MTSEEGAALAVVAVGGNLPGRFASVRESLEAAIGALPDAGLEVVRRSGFLRTEAWPDPAELEYLNAALIVRTRLSPREVLAALHAVEARFGRVRSAPNAPRTVDLDLIAYEQMTFEEPGLTLPHPRARERRFVLEPLVEIAPTWRFADGATAAELLARLPEP